MRIRQTEQEHLSCVEGAMHTDGFARQRVTVSGGATRWLRSSLSAVTRGRKHKQGSAGKVGGKGHLLGDLPGESWTVRFRDWHGRSCQGKKEQLIWCLKENPVDVESQHRCRQRVCYHFPQVVSMFSRWEESTLKKEVELHKYGVPRCPGCIVVIVGLESQSHSAECTTTIDQLMREDAQRGGSERIVEAERRRRRWRDRVPAPSGTEREV